jgi:DNA-binding LacI/PurR family transcriptional regulator
LNAERGVAVPADISVAGFDDLDLASHVRSALSTVRVPTYEMGRVAALLLLDLIAGQRRRKTRLQTDVILRESTAAPGG